MREVEDPILVGSPSLSSQNTSDDAIGGTDSPSETSNRTLLESEESSIELEKILNQIRAEREHSVTQSTSTSKIVTGGTTGAQESTTTSVPLQTIQIESMVFYPPTKKHSTINPSTVEPSTVEPSTVKSSTIRSSTVKPSTMKSSTVRRSTAKPSTVKSSRLQPSTVERSTAQPSSTVTTTTPFPTSTFDEKRFPELTDITRRESKKVLVPRRKSYPHHFETRLERVLSKLEKASESLNKRPIYQRSSNLPKRLSKVGPYAKLYPALVLEDPEGDTNVFVENDLGMSVNKLLNLGQSVNKLLEEKNIDDDDLEYF